MNRNSDRTVNRLWKFVVVVLLIGGVGGVSGFAVNYSTKGSLERERDELNAKLAERDHDLGKLEAKVKSVAESKSELKKSAEMAKKSTEEAEQRMLAAQKQQKVTESQLDDIQKQLAQTTTKVTKIEKDLVDARMEGTTIKNEMRAMTDRHQAEVAAAKHEAKVIVNKAQNEAKVMVNKAQMEIKNARDEAEKEKRQARLHLATSVVRAELGEKPESRLTLVENEIATEQADALTHDRIALRMARAKLLILSAQQLQPDKEKAEMLKKLEQAEKASQDAAMLAEKAEPILVYPALFFQGTALEMLGALNSDEQMLDRALSIFEKANTHARNFEERRQHAEARIRIESLKIKKPSNTPNSESLAPPRNGNYYLVAFVATADEEQSQDELVKKLSDVEKQIEKNPSPSLYQSKASLHLELLQPNLAVEAALLGLEKLQKLPPDDVTRGPLQQSLILSLRKAEQQRGKKTEERAKDLEEKNAKHLGALNLNRIRLAETEKERDQALATRNAAEKERKIATADLTKTKDALQKAHKQYFDTAKERDQALANRNTAVKERKLALSELTTAKDALDKSQHRGKDLETKLNVASIALTAADAKSKLTQDKLTRAESDLSDAAAKLKAAQLRIERTVEGPAPLNQRALIVADVPADAVLFVNDKPHSAPGQSKRQFMLPRLDANKLYDYKLHIEVVREGKTIKTGHQTVSVRVGTEIGVTLAEGQGGRVTQPTTKALDQRGLVVAEVPAGVRLYVNSSIHPVTNKASREFITGPIGVNGYEIIDLQAEGTTSDGRYVNTSNRVVCFPGSVLWVSLQN